MVSVNYQTPKEGELRLILSGKLDTDGAGFIWSEVIKKVFQSNPNALEIDATGIDYCDGAGIGLLLELERKQQENKKSIRIVGLKSEFAQLMKLLDPGQLSKPERQPPLFRRVAETIGKNLIDFLLELQTQVAFTGEVCVKLISTLFRPGNFRWKDTFLIAEKSGADAVGIIALLGFLIGVILAFQAAIAMKNFGAEIYVADLVVIVLFRELGPLLTAFVLSARTGSAFAAEIGTMKINEEVDALTTMGLEPVRFLVVPRVLAAVFVTPLITMFNNLFGIIGCGIVMISIGFAPITFLNRIQQATGLVDLFGGLAKTFVFGFLIAGIGCLRGLQTKTGASAVGDSATSAVVTSIVAIVIADGIFAVMYYFLGV